MSDPNLIADLVRAGLDPELVGRVANALIASADSSADYRQTPGDDAADRRRKRDRDYQKKRRKIKANSTSHAEANDAASSAVASADSSADSSADGGDERCELSSNLSFLSGKPLTEERKVKREQASRKGTRLDPSATISEADWQFARAQGHHDSAIKTMWAEFVDYWIGVPGQRGTKLDWPATWRNRVRQLSSKKPGIVNGARPNTMDTLDGVVERERLRAIGGDGPLLDLTPERP